jgi:hypothetical protein
LFHAQADDESRGLKVLKLQSERLLGDRTTQLCSHRQRRNFGNWMLAGRTRYATIGISLQNSSTNNATN